MRIPETFHQTIKPLPLKLQTTQLGTYMEIALRSGTPQAGEILSWRVSPDISQDTQRKSPDIFQHAYTFGGWIFLPLNVHELPWVSKQVGSWLGWGIFQKPDTEAVSLDEAMEQFNIFHRNLRDSIGLND